MDSFDIEILNRHTGRPLTANIIANMAKKAENGNPTRSGRIPSLKKSAVEAIKSLMPKKRSQKVILDSDNESVNSVSVSWIDNTWYKPFFSRAKLRKRKENFCPSCYLQKSHKKPLQQSQRPQAITKDMLTM